MLKNVEECWRMLKNVEECWRMLGNAKECWRLLKIDEFVIKKRKMVLKKDKKLVWINKYKNNWRLKIGMNNI